MQMPQPHIRLSVRGIFKRIYQNRRINVSASRGSLEEQLNLYLNHLGKHINQTFLQRDRKRIWDIIDRNNAVAKILELPNHRKIVKRQKQLIDNTALGLVFCIDGRIPAIFIGGRFARHFEIPAGEISTIKRKSDNKLIPDSSDLNEALRRIASTGDDLLEIIFAHTSLLNTHKGCAAMIAKKKAGFIEPKLTLEEANLKIIKEKSIPAISNIYGEFRDQLGLAPVKVTAIAALYDTDTFGIILNYDLRKDGNSLSITRVTNKYKDQMDEYFIKNNLVFGSFAEKFCDLKYFTPFCQNVLFVEENLLDGKAAPKLSEEVKVYIEKFYPDLTKRQKKALLFLLVRNVAFQYLAGISGLKRKAADHPFSKHGESYMAVAMRGATIGKFDPLNQGFASTPSDPAQAIANIKTMISIMGHSPRVRPYILFICNPVNSRDLKEFNQVLQRIMGSNAGLLRDIIEDKTLGEMIEQQALIPVPVLIEEYNREVLKIVDHSGYI